MKTIFKSKTFYLNLIAALAAFVPAVQTWLTANPETALAALGAANVLLRFATSGKVSLLGSSEPTAGTASGMFPCWLAWIAAAGILGCLPSCTTVVTKTTMPDGSVVEVTAKSSDPVAIQGACDLATEVLPLLDHLAEQKGGVATTRIQQTSTANP